MRTCITICSGGGLCDVGLKAAGYQPIGGVEIEPAIAEVYRANIGDHVTVQDVRDVQWNRFDKPTGLWASLPCTRASIANQNAGESSLDIEMAQATCRAIETLLPQWFILENVRGYKNFKAFGLILHTLEKLGYWHNGGEILNSADFSVPQTRVRLILRATRGDCVSGGQSGLFGGGKLAPLMHKEKWRGWYQAIEDLIPDLPESKFAEWQLARMESAMPETFLADCTHRTGADLTTRQSDEPAHTIASTHFRRPGNEPRAFITSGMANKYGESMTTRVDGEAGFTINAQQDQRQVLRAMLEQGRVVRMTPRALARFMGLSDSYLLPEKQYVNWVCGGRGELATTIIGNGVCPPFAEKIMRLHEPALR